MFLLQRSFTLILQAVDHNNFTLPGKQQIKNISVPKLVGVMSDHLSFESECVFSHVDFIQEPTYTATLSTGVQLMFSQ